MFRLINNHEKILGIRTQCNVSQCECFTFWICATYWSQRGHWLPGPPWLVVLYQRNGSPRVGFQGAEDCPSGLMEGPHWSHCHWEMVTRAERLTQNHRHAGAHWESHRLAVRVAATSAGWKHQVERLFSMCEVTTYREHRQGSGRKKSYNSLTHIWVLDWPSVLFWFFVTENTIILIK